MRTLDIKVLPGEPLDGTGRVRIHFFVRDDSAPTATPEGRLKPPAPPYKVGGVHGYIACRKGQQPLTSRPMGAMTAITPYSDDVRAANCPECLATEIAKISLKANEDTVPAPAYPAPTGA